jgi:hypothetical protein
MVLLGKERLQDALDDFQASDESKVLGGSLIPRLHEIRWSDDHLEARIGLHYRGRISLDLGVLTYSATPRFLCDVARKPDPACKDLPVPRVNPQGDDDADKVEKMQRTCGCQPIGPTERACFDIKHSLALKACTAFKPDPRVLIGLWPLHGLVASFVNVLVGPLTAGLGHVLHTFIDIYPLLLTFFYYAGGRLAVIRSLEELSCGPLVDDCVECKVPVEVEHESVGRLRLSRVSPSADWLEIGGIRCNPRVDGKNPAVLVVESGSWHYRQGHCFTDPNPVGTVLLKNTGELPLVVCEVAPRLTSTAEVPALRVLPANLPALILPGQSRSFAFQAHVMGRTDYNPDARPPLLLRILTSHGARIINVNANETARPGPVDLLPQCRSRFSTDISIPLPRFPPVPRWRNLPFKDPLPFRPQDRLMERLDVRVAAGAGSVLQASAPTGQLLGRALPVSGVASLSVTQARPPGDRHTDLGISFSLAGPGGLPQGPGQAPLMSISGQEDGGPQPELTRILYNEGSFYQLRSRILGAQKLGEALLVLTEGELRMAEVLGGWLRWTDRVRVEKPRALLISERGPVVLHDRGLTLFDAGLRPIWQRPGPIGAAAAIGDRLWVAGERGLCELVPGALAETSPPLQAAALHQVGGLAVADGTLLAAVQGRLLDLGTWPPRDLGRCAGRVTAMLGLLAAENGQGVVLLDRHGRAHAEYPARPWHASLLEWPGTAIEVRAEPGVLALYDRYETEIDLMRLPPEILLPALRQEPWGTSRLPASAIGTSPFAMRSRAYI